ncbi:hypothetical protein [Pseudomonas mosselii]|uniref:hypothetical protein n=1 Tax=Pseudomonas mosselii TaxID=78327 RepID=UPI001F2A8A55|nr:hypothetical protein [Pseudomonas mosselii]
MNTTEMVSVPRERALQLINLLAEVARTAHWLADNSEDCGDEGIDCQRVDFEALSDALDKCEELPELPDSVYVRDGWLRAADELRALLAQPAEQHQGEPAAIVTTDANDKPVIEFLSYDLEYGTELYTHAAPGELERLRAELGEVKGEYDRSANKVAALRAQLAEAHALLRKIEGYHWAKVEPEERARTRAELRDMLSASAALERNP